MNIEKSTSLSFLLIAFAICLVLYSCTTNSNSSNVSQASVQKEDRFLVNQFSQDSLVSSKMKHDIVFKGLKFYNQTDDLIFLSGYNHFSGTKAEVGQYLYNVKNGVVLNSCMDTMKTQRRIEDGNSDKTYVMGLERDKGVRMYSEYDDGESNRKTKFQIDTSNLSAEVSVSINNEMLSRLLLKNKHVIIDKGIPAYTKTIDAANDSSLPLGSLFKISNGDGTSQLHIKD